MEAVLPSVDQTGGSGDGASSIPSSSPSFDYAVKHDILPIGAACWALRQDRERPHSRGCSDRSSSVAAAAVKAQRGVHPANICLKWAAQWARYRSLLRQGAQYQSGSTCVTGRSADSRRWKPSPGDDRNCRLIKGQVFRGRRPWLGRSLGSGWQDYRKRIRLL